MRRSPLFVAAMAAFALLAGNAHAEAVTYKLDPNHTVVLAQWDHGGYSHPVANFGQVDGTLVYDADDIAASSVQVTLPLAGLNSFVPKFDEHLRSDDFFDAAKYPNATFTSTKVEAAGEGRLKVTGDLTIKDNTRPVVLDVVLNKTGERNGRAAIGFDATATVKRSDFGVDLFVPNIGDEVKLTITTEAMVPKPEAGAKAEAKAGAK